MAQGITIKGKTTAGHNVEVQVDGQGRIVLAGGDGGLAPTEFAAWEVSSASSTEDLIQYFDENGTVVRSVLITFTSTAKSSIERAEIQ
jgi:hypothetical protein